ncbi:hypothetical protein evm_013545 [Chilo suppressalis]|nr:hypothetical protein evm_013545 [Chilo suppressalis]
MCGVVCLQVVVCLLVLAVAVHAGFIAGGGGGYRGGGGGSGWRRGGGGGGGGGYGGLIPISWIIANSSKDHILSSLNIKDVGIASGTPELYAIGPHWSKVSRLYRQSKIPIRGLSPVQGRIQRGGHGEINVVKVTSSGGEAGGFGSSHGGWSGGGGGFGGGGWRTGGGGSSGWW